MTYCVSRETKNCSLTHLLSLLLLLDYYYVHKVKNTQVEKEKAVYQYTEV